MSEVVSLSGMCNSHMQRTSRLSLSSLIGTGSAHSLALCVCMCTCMCMGVESLSMWVMQGDLKQKQDKAEAAKKELAELMVQAQEAAKKEQEGAEDAQAKADDLKEEVGSL